MRLGCIIHCGEKTVNEIELLDTRKDPEERPGQKKKYHLVVQVFKGKLVAKLAEVPANGLKSNQ